MKYVTEFMNKVFSDSTSDDYKEMIAGKIDEARQFGMAELDNGVDNLSFAEVNGDVAIEDKKNGNEVTLAKTTGEGDTKLVAAAPSTTATEKDVISPRIKGEDGEHLPEGESQDDVKVSIEPAITDPEKAGMKRSFSLVFSGFDSPDQANEFYSMLDNDENESEENLTFSDDELQNVAFAATQANNDCERLMGTQDLNLAYSLIDDAEQLKAYSVLAESYGHDLSDVYEAAQSYSDYAQEVINNVFSDTDVNDYFSNLDEDEANEFFSNLDDVTADVLYSALNDPEENYTFSDVDEIADQVYSELPLEESVNETFSDASEDEINELFSELTPSEMNVVESILDENPNATFSDLNEGLAEINTPLNEMFSDEDEANEFFSDASDEEVELFSEMANDSDTVYTYSDYLDALDQYDQAYSDEKLETLANNATELDKAANDLKETKDPELAKKVKLLADETVKDAEEASDEGHDTDDVKKMCSAYSELAEDVIAYSGEDYDPEEVAENVFEEKPVDSYEDDDPKETKEECECKSDRRYSYNGLDDGEQRVFAQSTDGNLQEVNTVNPCLTSVIN